MEVPQIAIVEVARSRKVITADVGGDLDTCQLNVPLMSPWSVFPALL